MGSHVSYVWLLLHIGGGNNGGGINLLFCNLIAYKWKKRERRWKKIFNFSVQFSGLPLVLVIFIFLFIALFDYSRLTLCNEIVKVSNRQVYNCWYFLFWASTVILFLNQTQPCLHHHNLSLNNTFVIFVEYFACQK